MSVPPAPAYGRAPHQTEEQAMADTRKLEVDKVLGKLRRDDAIPSKQTQRDNKLEELNEETQRLRALRARVERDQGRGSS